VFRVSLGGTVFRVRLAKGKSPGSGVLLSARVEFTVKRVG